jgi:hypothetical protein
MHTLTHLRKCGLVALLLPALVFGAEAKAKHAAFLQSLVLPGWGQYTLGKKNAALGFLGTELLMFGSMLSLHSYGVSARIDYQAMAATYAGVRGNHPHDFYVDVGNWMNVDEFNQQRLRERGFDQLYTSESDRWQWDSDQHRAEMRNRRIKSDRAINSVLYLVGGVVLNHVASAIHAGRASAKMRQADMRVSPPTWNVAVAPVSYSGGLQLTLTRAF